jgi:hypothetical protein
MAETRGSARARSVALGHAYALGSRGGAWTPSRTGMARGAYPLGRECAGTDGPTRGSVGAIGSFG